MSLFKKKDKKEIKESAPAEKIVRHASSVKTVLKQPWVSERATMLASQNKYVFLVFENATKPSVREEVQRRYGVKVTAVNMVSRAGKMKRFGYKMSRRGGIKKAIVTVKAGDKIEME
jgi:large subunit ribosomal protein L23